MTADITPIRPDQQSCLAHAQPIRPAISTTYTGQCRNFRVQAADPLKGTVELEIATAWGRKVEILQGLPPKLIGRLVAHFGDGETRREGE